ncbi:uncharacterized protein L199_006994 [Kwoniella botswanensis]|uniref:uncharacterized protein n=1 Tax=Kwoniella botswanensis TaxID=1268659 RepID=UPI00315C7507
MSICQSSRDFTIHHCFYKSKTHLKGVLTLSKTLQRLYNNKENLPANLTTTRDIPSDGDTRAERSLHPTVESDDEGSKGSTSPATPSSDADQVDELTSSHEASAPESASGGGASTMPGTGFTQSRSKAMVHVQPYISDGVQLDKQGDEGWYKWREARYIIGAVADAEAKYDADPVESFAVSVDLRDRLRNRSLPGIEYRPEQSVVAFLSNNTRIRLESWETDFNKEFEERKKSHEGGPNSELADQSKMQALHAKYGQSEVYKPLNMSRYETQNQQRWQEARLTNHKTENGSLYFRVQGDRREDSGSAAPEEEEHVYFAVCL